MGYTLYESGGSVATFAIDLGIRMHCKRIIVVGLDMGYPGEQTHAGGVGKKLVDTQNLRLVEGVGGRQVRTGKTLDIYRRWIERRIESETEIEWINASNGARNTWYERTNTGGDFFEFIDGNFKIIQRMSG